MWYQANGSEVYAFLCIIFLFYGNNNCFYKILWPFSLYVYLIKNFIQFSFSVFRVLSKVLQALHPPHPPFLTSNSTVPAQILLPSTLGPEQLLPLHPVVCHLTSVYCLCHKDLQYIPSIFLVLGQPLLVMCLLYFLFESSGFSSWPDMYDTWYDM